MITIIDHERKNYTVPDGYHFIINKSGDDDMSVVVHARFIDGCLQKIISFDYGEYMAYKFSTKKVIEGQDLFIHGFGNRFPSTKEAFKHSLTCFNNFIQKHCQ